MEACKAQLCSGRSTGGGSLLLGLRVRTSSCSISAISALFAPPLATSIQNTNLAKQEFNGNLHSMITSEYEGFNEVGAIKMDIDVDGEDRVDSGECGVKLAKCFGTITSYCPGNDEHFVVFDNKTVIAPKWVRVDRIHLEKGDYAECIERERIFVEKDIARRPNDVELLFEWDFPLDSVFCCSVKDCLKDGKPGHSDKGKVMIELESTEKQEEQGNDMLVCGLCGMGNFEDDDIGMGLGAVMTCTVCCDQHFHRHCMPMGRVLMDENQSWRCWHCACKYSMCKICSFMNHEFAAVVLVCRL
jgi:hypothetical protein